MFRKRLDQDAAYIAQFLQGNHFSNPAESRIIKLFDCSIELQQCLQRSNDDDATLFLFCEF